MSSKPRSSGYSAAVDLNLRVNGCIFPLSHTAHDRVVLMHEMALPDGTAEIIITIDGEEMRRSVEIADRHLVRRIVPIGDASHDRSGFVG